MTVKRTLVRPAGAFERAMMSRPDSEVAERSGDPRVVLGGDTVLTMDDTRTVLPEADVMATDA